MRSRVEPGSASPRCTVDPNAKRWSSVALDVLVKSAEEASCGVEEADPFQALARYMHRAIDLRISAVFPVLLDRVSLDNEEIASARRFCAAIQGLIESARWTARCDGMPPLPTLNPARAPQPAVARAFSNELNAALAHRHLDLVLDGLRSKPPADPPRACLDRRSISRISRLSRRIQQRETEGPSQPRFMLNAQRGQDWSRRVARRCRYSLAGVGFQAHGSGQPGSSDGDGHLPVH
jgi:hypothetical protein